VHNLVHARLEVLSRNLNHTTAIEQQPELQFELQCQPPKDLHFSSYKLYSCTNPPTPLFPTPAPQNMATENKRISQAGTVVMVLHTILEIGVGLMMFVSGESSTAGAGEAEIKNGAYRLYKRWHAAGLISMGLLGLLGACHSYSTSEGKAVRKVVVLVCCTFHTLAMIAMFIAAAVEDVMVIDGEEEELVQTWAGATVANIHLWFAFMFGCVLVTVFKAGKAGVTAQ
jgi:hypothetical protein